MTDRIMTPLIPTTEISVSIADQVLNVSLTVIPKYWLMSQKPASLTCDRNSEPQPIASASSGALTDGALATRGPMPPAAVVIATVALPVASRMSTATRQPSSS